MFSFYQLQQYTTKNICLKKHSNEDINCKIEMYTGILETNIISQIRYMLIGRILNTSTPKDLNSDINDMISRISYRTFA